MKYENGFRGMLIYKNPSFSLCISQKWPLWIKITSAQFFFVGLSTQEKAHTSSFFQQLKHKIYLSVDLNVIRLVYSDSTQNFTFGNIQHVGVIFKGSCRILYVQTQKYPYFDTKYDVMLSIIKMKCHLYFLYSM